MTFERRSSVCMCASSNSNQSGQVVILRYIPSLVFTAVFIDPNNEQSSHKHSLTYNRARSHPTYVACALVIDKRSTYNVIALKCTYIIEYVRFSTQKHVYVLSRWRISHGNSAAAADGFSREPHFPYSSQILLFS